ncbi:Ig-like domain-containing protein [Stenotrophomonas sp.]|uniref:Ig-like domain-containing protein n=1 Tax=Stenotrophomonas sp. TaxID=69392 RepID=UPI0028AE7E2D|nr:Ig-like domain-containing protein [Stenotrophomonas sp.]
MASASIAHAMALLALLLSPSVFAQSYPNPLNNSATVTAPVDVGDPALGNNTAIDTNALALQAQLSVTKTLLSATPVAAGGAVQYRIQVSNAGPSAATAVGVADTVSALLTNVTWSCQPTTAASSCALANGTGNAVNVQVNVGVGDSVVLLVNGTAPTSTPATVPANTVSLVLPPGTTDPTPGDNSATTPAVPVQANALVANNDTFATPLSSTIGGNTPSVLTNDTLNGAPVNGANLIIALQNAPAGFTINAAGVIAVPAGAAAGATTLGYQICENASPTNCATATASVVIAPTAVNDSFNAVGGSASLSGSVAANDNAPAGAVFSAIGTPPAGLTVTSAGTFTYAPPGGIATPTSFQYQVCLPAPNATVCATATASVVVNANALVAVDDTLTPAIAPGAGGVTTSVLQNDTFNGGAVPQPQVTLSLVGAPTGFVINANGTVQVPATAAAGPLALTYRFCENALPANCATATANLVVSPDAVNDTVSTSGGGQPATGSLATNDNIASGSTYVLGSPATRGTAVVNADGTFSYTPLNGNTGPDSFTYQVCLPAPNPGVCDTATVSVNVAANQLLAVDDLFATPLQPGTTTVVSLLGNDTLNGAAVPPAAVTLTLSGAPLGYAATAGGQLSIPAGATAGAVSFSYQICEVATPTSCATANVQLVVAPDAVDDAFAATAGVVFNGNVTGNDNAGPNAQFSLLAVAAHGTVTVNADGSFTYTAQAAYTGPDTFRYQLCLPAPNTGVCDAATVTMNVGAASIVANNDDFTAAPLTSAGGLTASVLANDTFNGAPITPAQASLSLINAPPAGYTLESNGQLVVPAGAPAGPISLTYQLCQAGTGNCATATIAVVIAPDAVADAYATQVATPVSGNVSVNDNVAAGTTYAVTGPTPPGLVFNADGSFTYTPPAQFTGTTPFNYQACLAAPLVGVCDTAAVTLNVNAGTLVATPDDFRSAIINPASGGTTNSVLANDTINGAVPPAPAQVILSLVGAPAGYVLNSNGTVSVPGGADAGAVNFSYQLCEAALPTNCDTAAVQLLLAPVAVNDNFSTPAGVVLTGSVAANDNVPATGSFALSGAAPAGLVFNPNGSFTYTPPVGTQGVITFAYQACLPAPDTAVCSGATVTLNVNAGTLVASDDDFRGTPINPVVGGSTVSVLANDSLNGTTPPASAEVLLSLVGAPSGYTLAADGTLAIAAGVPAGAITLTYQLCETALDTNCDSAQVQLLVAPLASADVFSTPAAQLLAGNVGSNDNAPVGAVFTLTTTAPAGLQFGPDGSFLYTPPANFTGPVAFTYQVCLPAPDTAQCSTAAATINVNAGTLVARDDDFSASPLAPGSSSPASVLANDTLDGVTPPASPSVILSLVGAPAGYALDANGILQVPSGAAGGATVLTYQVCEAVVPSNCASATIRLVVTPSATDDAFSTPAGQALNGNVGSNDNAPAGALFTLTSAVPAGLTFNADGSFLYVAPTGTVGPVNFSYRVCLPAPDGALCATANAAIAITVGTLAAVNDDFSTAPISPVGGGSTASVLLNDSLNGATPPAAADVLLSLPGAPAGISITADGTVSVAAGTPAGASSLNYQLCEAAAPGNCAIATLRLVVAPSAVDDALSTPVGVPLNSSVATNDNAVPDAQFTVSGAAPAGLVLGTNGTLTYTPPVGFSGPVSFTYQVCLPAPDGAVCATANATINVNTGTLVAVDDTFATPVAPGGVSPSVIGNDTLNAVAPLPADVVLSLVGAPTGFTIAADGTINVATGTLSGATTLTYQICEAAASTNCDTAAISLIVAPAPANDAFAVQAGQTVNGNVSTNDSMPIGSIYTVQGTPPAGVTFAADGSFSYTPPAGTTTPTSFVYQACLPAPDSAVCATATATLNINNGALVAVDDAFGAVAPGGVTPSVLGNDVLNGLSPPAAATVSLALVGAPTGFSLDPNGTVSVGAAAPAGAITLGYQICEVAAANNCATANIALVVRPTPVDDVIAVQSGQPNTGNVSGNDTMPAGSTWSVGVPPQGLVFNSNGSFTYTPPAGTVGPVTFSYQACLPAPDATVCGTANATLNIGINALVASDDTFAVPLGTGSVTPSVLVNDSLNGVTPPASTAVQLLLVAPPAGFVINNDGTVQIPSDATAGATTLTYQLCESASPTNCDTAAIRFIVTPAPQNDAFAVQAGGTIANASVATNDSMPAGSSWAVQGTAPAGLVFNGNGTFSYTPPVGTTGAVTFTYRACLPAPNAAVCGDATATLNVNQGTLVAGDDSFTGIAPGTSTPSVLGNDVLNSVSPPPAATVQLTLVGAPTGYVIAADGTIAVPVGTMAGPGTLTYQICETAAPANCDTATVSLVINPSPQNDAYSVQAGGTISNGNVAANDWMPAGSTWAVQGVPPDGVSFNPDGTFTFTPPGTTSPLVFVYQTCLPAPNAALCATASVTLNVNTGTLVATDDVLSGVAAGGTTGVSVLANDALNGVTPPLAGDVILSLVGAPAGFTLTPAGTISVAIGTVSGPTTLTYQICEAAAATNCDTASVTVVVSPTPQDDAFTVQAGQTLSNSVATNDNLPAGASFTVQGALPAGVVFNVDGSFAYTPPPGAPASVNFTYQACLPAPNAALCAPAVVTLNTSSGTLAAGNDTLSGVVPGTTSAASVLANDSLNGVSPPAAANVVLTLIGAPGGFAITPSGTITVSSGVDAGPSTFTYQVCEAVAPGNCATASVTVIVTPTPQDDAFSVMAGQSLSDSVASNDRMPAGSSWAVQGTPPAGLLFNLDGSFTYTPPIGTPSPAAFTYQTCLPAPDNNLCSTATVTLNINNGTLSAGDDTLVGVLPGAATGTSVLANDSLNGVSPPLPADVLLSLVGAPGGFTINPDGTITVGSGVTSGPTTITYQICEAAAPSNCDTASVTVVVTPAPQNDAYAVQAGQTLANTVAANDSTPTGAIHTLQDTAPAGFAFAADGAFTYTPAVGAVGPITLAYQVCLPAPNASLCGRAILTISINNGQLVAGDDTITGVAPGTISTASVLANDSLNGVTPPLPATVALSLVGAPAGFTITPDGRITVSSGVVSGATTITYQICEAAAPTNCDTASVTVVVSPAPLNDAFSVQVGQMLSNTVASNDNMPAGALYTLQGTVPGLSLAGNGAFTYTPPGGTPSPVGFTYQTCLPAPYATVCATATATININNGTLVAGDDVLTNVLPGTSSGTSVLVNDQLNGVSPPAPATVLLSLVGAPTGFSLNADGTVAVGTGVLSGATTLTYQICEAAATANCTTASALVVVTPAPQNDAFTVPGGVPFTGSVAINDNVPAGAAYTLTSGAVAGLFFDGSGGFTYTPPSGTTGQVSFTYRVCLPAPYAAQCGDASVTLTLSGSANVVLAVNDDFSSTPVDPSVGGTIARSVLDNDTFNNVSPPPVGSVIASLTGSTPGYTMNNQGQIMVAAGVQAGQVQLAYQLCENGVPTNCTTAIATVRVQGPVGALLAVDDSGGPVGPAGRARLLNVFTNDTFNTAPLDPAQVSFTPVATTALTFSADGWVDVAAGLPAGSYTTTYTLCLLNQPTVCDSGTVSVTIIAAEPGVDAENDRVDLPQDGVIEIDVLGNDRVNGTPIDPDSVTLSIVSPPPYGTATVLPRARIRFAALANFSGEQAFDYQVCDVTDPAMCARATVTVMVDQNVLSLVDDAATADTAAPLVIDVLANDSTRAAPLDPASLQRVVAPTHGAVQCANGLCTYTPAAAFAGTDSFRYRVCDVSIPTPMCAEANVSVTVAGQQAVLRLTKSAAKRSAQIGDLVRYTVTIDNVGEVDANGATLLDTLPPGFTFVSAGFAVQDADNDARTSGVQPLRIDGIDIPVGERATVVYYLRVGAGTGTGVHTNRITAIDGENRTIGNVASADVDIITDPLLDESLIVGSVFDDRNGNGIQDDGERGIPGVRVAAVEGLLMETDAFGRYHLVGIPGGQARGRNFILKVDPSTVPAGARFTTPNPLVRRITPGLPARFDFGVQMPEGALRSAPSAGAAVPRPARIELGDALFVPGSARLPADRTAVLAKAAQALETHAGGRLTLATTADGAALARQRASALQAALRPLVSGAVAAATTIDVLAADGSTLHSLRLDDPPASPAGTNSSLREGR